jgi:mRNA interferase RelE/StbE
MEKWRFLIIREAESDLKRLDENNRCRVLEKLNWFTENFEHVIPLPLGDPWKGFFKLRVGDWRVIYEVENEKRLITIHYIDRRDKIYKRHKKL